MVYDSSSSTNYNLKYSFGPEDPEPCGTSKPTPRGRYMCTRYVSLAQNKGDNISILSYVGMYFFHDIHF